MHPQHLHQLNDAHRADLHRLAGQGHVYRIAAPVRESGHQARRSDRWLLALARRIDPSVVWPLPAEPSTALLH